MLTINRPNGAGVIVRHRGQHLMRIYVHLHFGAGYASLNFDAPREVEIFRPEFLGKLEGPAGPIAREAESVEAIRAARLLRDRGWTVEPPGSDATAARAGRDLMTEADHGD